MTSAPPSAADGEGAGWRGYPRAPRLLAAAGAVATAGLFTGFLPYSLAMTGYPIAAALLVLTSFPLVLFLALLGASPARLQRLLATRTAIDLRDGGHVAAAVIMAGTLFLVLGYGALVSGAAAIETVLYHEGGEEVLREVDGHALFAGLVQTIIVLTLPPFFYVAYVHGGGPRAALHRLGLRLDGAGRATLIGLAATFAIYLVLTLASLVAVQFFGELPPNERALAIARAVTPLGAVGLAAGAAVSEEVFFRGFLQPRVGLLLQAAIFALAHLSYVNVAQVIVVFILGLAFGLLYQRTGNLAAPIAGHFLFNLVNLLAAQQFA